jgi:hypothetical protein
MEKYARVAADINLAIQDLQIETEELKVKVLCNTD